MMIVFVFDYFNYYGYMKVEGMMRWVIGERNWIGVFMFLFLFFLFVNNIYILNFIIFDNIFMVKFNLIL